MDEVVLCFSVNRRVGPKKEWRQGSEKDLNDGGEAPVGSSRKYIQRGQQIVIPKAKACANK